ncbi:MAG TPA: HepT-like ribonuclease domain-containing protein [Bryobacteraceae bacterium]|nr:HepT-like ribonuclease domain-containing protein [Bryobacteraceae bacterium]
MRDIADAIDMIQQFTLGMDLDVFSKDPKTVAAVERKLSVISEAAVRLGDSAFVVCPGLPWHNIRGIGNWLRHQYDRVDIETIWNTIVGDLPPLKTAVRQALSLSDE